MMIKEQTFEEDGDCVEIFMLISHVRESLEVNPVGFVDVLIIEPFGLLYAVGTFGFIVWNGCTTIW